MTQKLPELSLEKYSKWEDQEGKPLFVSARGSNAAIQCLHCGGPVLFTDIKSINPVIAGDRRDKFDKSGKPILKKPAICGDPNCKAKHWFDCDEANKTVRVSFEK